MTKVKSDIPANTLLNPRRKKIYIGRIVLPYAMVLPTLILLAVFTFYPSIDMVINSFYDVNVFKGNTFVGFQNYVRFHALHTQFPFLARCGFATFLTHNVGNIGMLQIFSRNSTLNMIADHKTGAIGIRKHDESPFFCNPAKKRHLLFILENSKSGGFQNGSIQNLAEGIFIVAALHYNCFLDFNHCGPPAQAAKSAVPEDALDRQKKFSSYSPFPKSAMLPLRRTPGEAGGLPP